MTRQETGIFVAAVAAAIIGALLGWDWLHWIGKPLATLVLLAVVRARGAGNYGRAIAAGLALSLVGDVLLMLPQDLFLPGLIAFFAAHVAYIRAFSLGLGIGRDRRVLIGFGLVALAIVGLLWSGVPGAMRLPVAAYALVLALMAAQALTRVRITRDPADALAALGAVLFMTSDTLLAVNRFLGALPLSPLLVLGTYYAAQWLIARSALRRP